MAFDDLTQNDIRVYEYLRQYDFEEYPWSTPDASMQLGMTEDEIYDSLSNLAKFLKDKVWIYYEDGGIRIIAE